MESQLRKASSAGILSNNVIRVILHSEFRTKGKMSAENMAEHAGTVMDTLFCAVGSGGSLELPLGNRLDFTKGHRHHREHTTISRGHANRGMSAHRSYSAY